MKGKLFALGFIVVLSTLIIISGCAPSEPQPTPPSTGAGIEYCVDKSTGAQLSYQEAVEIARNSECLSQGQLKETHFCNENTGTWWIDLEMDNPGCNPACVIHLADKKAEINWRCTGLLLPGDAPLEEPAPTASASAPPPQPPEGPDPKPGWQVYINQDFGYRFKHPPEAKITEMGAVGFPTDELPPGMTADEYLVQLRQKYSGKLCVGIEYGLAYMYISAPPNQGFRYAPCGRTGVGAGELTDKDEAIVVGGRTYTATGFEFTGAGGTCKTLECHNETLVIVLEDGTRIEYGARPEPSALYDDYLLQGKETLIEILASYERVPD